MLTHVMYNTSALTSHSIDIETRTMPPVADYGVHLCYPQGEYLCHVDWIRSSLTSRKRMRAEVAVRYTLARYIPPTSPSAPVKVQRMKRLPNQVFVQPIPVVIGRSTAWLSESTSLSSRTPYVFKSDKYLLTAFVLKSSLSCKTFHASTSSLLEITPCLPHQKTGPSTHTTPTKPHPSSSRSS